MYDSKGYNLQQKGAHEEVPAGETYSAELPSPIPGYATPWCYRGSWQRDLQLTLFTELIRPAAPASLHSRQ